MDLKFFVYYLIYMYVNWISCFEACFLSFPLTFSISSLLYFIIQWQFSLSVNCFVKKDGDLSCHISLNNAELMSSHVFLKSKIG